MPQLFSLNREKTSYKNQAADEEPPGRGTFAKPPNHAYTGSDKAPPEWSSLSSSSILKRFARVVRSPSLRKKKSEW